MRIVDDSGRALMCARIEEKAIGALSWERIGILRMMARRPMYPAQIARERGIGLQSVYYHMRLLEKAGLIGFVERQERNGGMAKLYSANAGALALILDDDGWKAAMQGAPKPPAVLSPFIKGGSMDGLIVVGSPDPHGKFRARATETGVLELAMLIGRYAAPAFPLYTLDTQIEAQERAGNLILAGGPKVNTLVAEINGALPVRFSSGFGEIYSTRSRKSYGGNVGVVEMIANPDARARRVLVVGGLNHHGTRAAVLSMLKEPERIAARGAGGYAVVEGFDEDGDGRIDAYEISEEG